MRVEGLGHRVRSRSALCPKLRAGSGHRVFGQSLSGFWWHAERRHFAFATVGRSCCRWQFWVAAPRGPPALRVCFILLGAEKQSGKSLPDMVLMMTVKSVVGHAHLAHRHAANQQTLTKQQHKQTIKHIPKLIKQIKNNKNTPCCKPLYPTANISPI